MNKRRRMRAAWVAYERAGLRVQTARQTLKHARTAQRRAWQIVLLEAELGTLKETAR